MARVWELSSTRGNDLLMLLAIADFADDEGNAYPAVSTLAEKCRIQGRGANKILASLRKIGELEIRQNEGPKGTNRYRITLPACPLSHRTPPVQMDTLSHGTAPPVQMDPIPLSHGTDEPSVNHQEPSTRACDALDSDKSNRSCSHSSSLVVDDGFADFWKQYPKKVAKPAAEKAWRKLKPSGQMHADLLAGLKKQKASDQWQKDGGKFIPHPATWLNQRRWEDAGEGASLSDDDREWLKTGNLSAPLPADDDRSWLMGGKP